MSHKILFQPKYPEVAAQCASCPFRFGNNEEFGAILNKLEKSCGLPGKVTKKQITQARIRIMSDVGSRGDFMCHLSAYTPEMKQRPRTEWRQCAGATRHYRES